MEKQDFLNELGKYLRQVRKEKGISLREMELRGDISRQKISKIELGESNPSIFTLRKIAQALDTDLAELLKDFHK